MRQTALRLAGLSGWRRLGVAFAAGALSALGFAPLDLFPLLLLGFAVLVLLLDGCAQSSRPVRAAAAAGWAFAFGQFLIGWHWIGYAFLVDPSAHLWQLPFAVTLLPAGLALYGAAAAAATAFFWRNGPGRVFVLAVSWSVVEWLRGHMFGGFPWNLPGYGWGASLALLQSVSLFGAYGLSFLTVALGASLAELGARRWRAPGAMLILFAGLWVFGMLRLAAPPPPDVPGVRLRLVQPAIPQAEKYKRALMARNWQRLLVLSQAPSAVKGFSPTHIIWPEAAPPFLLARASFALDEIALLTADNRVLITGAERVEHRPGALDFYNSLYVFGPAAQPVAQYDKFHLVPFGEYVPLAGWLNKIGVTKLTPGETGFSEGPGPRSLDVPFAPRMAPLICYEIIFPHAVIARGPRPGWIVNVTDDSWFGPWAGPRQHLLIARARAIEEGLPVARAANTGISAVIDSYGRVRASLSLGRMGVVDASLPGAQSPPLYARIGDLGFLLLLLAGTAISWLLKAR